MSVNPAFDNFPLEALAIGKMVVSFGELELTFGLIAGTALGDQTKALRAIYRGRSIGGRIDLIDVLVRQEMNNVLLGDFYEEALNAIKFCLSIRNQYAHCHCAPGVDGLFFANLEDAASRSEGFDYDQKHVDILLLQEQEAFFDYTRLLLLALGDIFGLRLRGSTALGVPRPPTRSQPRKHNLASQHVPHWLNEDAKRQHLARALEVEGRGQQPERPPSVLRLTREEWAAKDAREGRSDP